MGLVLLKGIWQSRLKNDVGDSETIIVGPEKPRLKYLGLLFFRWPQRPKATICIPADPAPKSVFVHKGLIILDLSNDVTKERLVLSTSINNQNIRGP